MKLTNYQVQCLVADAGREMIDPTNYAKVINYIANRINGGNLPPAEDPEAVPLLLTKRQAELVAFAVARLPREGDEKLVLLTHRVATDLHRQGVRWEELDAVIGDGHKWRTSGKQA